VKKVRLGKQVLIAGVVNLARPARLKGIRMIPGGHHGESYYINLPSMTASPADIVGTDDTPGHKCRSAQDNRWKMPSVRAFRIMPRFRGGFDRSRWPLTRARSSRLIRQFGRRHRCCWYTRTFARSSAPGRSADCECPQRKLRDIPVALLWLRKRVYNPIERAR